MLAGRDQDLACVVVQERAYLRVLYAKRQEAGSFQRFGTDQGARCGMRATTLSDQEVLIAAGILGLIVIPGTCVALGRDGRFSLAHLLCGLFAYGITLTFLKKVFIDHMEKPTFFVYMMVALFPVFGGGVMTGHTNEAAVHASSRWIKRLFFIAGLLTPLAFIFAAIAIFVLFISIGSYEFFTAVCSFAALMPLGLPIGITVYSKHLACRPPRE